MNFKTYTSKPIDPSLSNSIFLDNIYPEEDERSIVAGVVMKETNDGGAEAAQNALVSLYQGTSAANSCPIYHAYTDEKGRFLFPVNNTRMVYQVKAMYCRLNDEETYRPFLSKPFRTEKGAVHKVMCFIEKECRKTITGFIMNQFHEPRKNVPVTLYITVGINRIPIVELANTKTDQAGRFDLSIMPEGSYCIKMMI